MSMTTEKHNFLEKVVVFIFGPSKFGALRMVFFYMSHEKTPLTFH